MTARGSSVRALQVLRDKVDDVNARDPKRGFLPPLSEARLASLESALEVPLPEAHRAYLRVVSGGQRLSGEDAAHLTLEHAWGALGGGDPALPFPVSAKDARAVARRVAAGAKPTPAITLRYPHDGVWPLFDAGGSNLAFVVTAGPCRGQVWQSWDRGCTPCITGRGSRARVETFLEWVTRLVDDAVECAPPPIDPTVTRVLHVSEELTAVPPAVRGARALEHLALSLNPIAELPEWIGELSSLKKLILDATALSALPETIGGLRSLERLSVPDTALRALPSSIGELSALTWLDASRTPLQSLPASIGSCRALAKIELRQTEIEALPETVAGLSSLDSLDLSGSAVRAIPPALARTPLRRLVLRHMSSLDWSTLEVLAGSRLRSLEVAGPLPAEALSALATLDQLEELCLIGVGLRELPDTIAAWPRLRALMLDQNELTSVPEDVLRAPSLETLILWSNPLGPGQLDAARAARPDVKIKG